MRPNISVNTGALRRPFASPLFRKSPVTFALSVRFQPTHWLLLAG